MDLHGQIMNLPMTGEPAGGSMAYKLGHRDARHAAAELALKADSAIDAMQAEIDRLRKDAERLRAALTVAVKQNENDMLMTGDALRVSRLALSEETKGR